MFGTVWGGKRVSALWIRWLHGGRRLIDAPRSYEPMRQARRRAGSRLNGRATGCPRVGGHRRLERESLWRAFSCLPTLVVYCSLVTVASRTRPLGHDEDGVRRWPDPGTIVSTGGPQSVHRI